MAELNSSGLVVDRLPDVLAKLQQQAVQKFIDLIPIGQDLNLDASSVLGRILSVVADPIRMQEEAVQAIYASKDIHQATGVQLDDLCYLSGVLRKGASKAEAMLICSGNFGTVVPKDSIVANKITGDNFLTQTSVTLDNTSCNGITFTITPATSYEFNWTVDSSVVVNMPITVSALITEPLTVIANRISSAIQTATDTLSATVDVDGKLFISLVNKNNTGSFSLTNATTTLSHKPVDSICQVSGLRPQDRNQINTIQTSVYGWTAAYNPFDAETGTEKMSDAELRQYHFDTKFGSSVSNKSAMYSALRKIKGVRYVNIAQNFFDTSVNGIPAHSFAPVVLGGNIDSIAQAILDTATLGVSSFGDVTNVAYDINSNPVQVQFSRPDLVPIQISLTLETYPEFKESSPQLIKQAIIDYISTLNVGDDILYSRLFTPINTVGGFSVVSMKIGRVGGVLGTTNIVMSHKEIASISFSDITFGGN